MVSPAHVPMGLNFLLKNESVVKGDSSAIKYYEGIDSVAVVILRLADVKLHTVD